MLVIPTFMSVTAFHIHKTMYDGCFARFLRSEATTDPLGA